MGYLGEKFSGPVASVYEPIGAARKTARASLRRQHNAIIIRRLPGRTVRCAYPAGLKLSRVVVSENDDSHNTYERQHAREGGQLRLQGIGRGFRGHIRRRELLGCNDGWRLGL